jgi:hypothetical protein
LRVLLSRGRIVKGEFNVVKRAHIFIVQDCDAMTVGSDSELNRLRFEKRKNALKVRVHSILTRAQVDRAYRQPLHDGTYLIKRQAIDAIRIAVTE